ncbi:hypothetical protein Ssi02_30800 [Sinosporangium siamense]|uniref:OmpR/PhoB-type domain-containing protein n=1 Tax=Sinosporangium siamense TaxID=1367973 RepID=A0A919RI77_9ACTN|nr:hypothetical protein Ssi02_30800 [Sinosporangium siamense]
MEVTQGDVTCTPTAPKAQQALSLLLLRANHIVSISALVDELWADNPPASAVITAQSYIYQIRRCIHPKEKKSRIRSQFTQQADTEDGVTLLTRSPGYILLKREGQLDLDDFTRLAGEGRALLDRGDTQAAAVLLRQAMSLWRGSSPLSGVRCGPLLHAHLTVLSEEWMRVLALRIQADMALGRHHDLVGELRSLVAAHPLNEWLHGRLITALYAVGRRGEALEACLSLSDTLRRELGVDLSLELRQLQHQILIGQPPTPGTPGAPPLTHAS